MKKSNYWASVLLLFSTFMAIGNANADAEIGAVVEGQLNLAKRTFALPPGKWTVVNSQEFTATTGVSNTGRIKQQYLVQTDSANRFVAATNIRTTISSATTNGWNDSNCDRKDTLFRDTFKGTLHNPQSFGVRSVRSL